MADCSIILYLECLKGLIYHFKKLGLIDGFNGMSTHLGHVMPKRTMSKTIEIERIYMHAI